MGKKTVILPDQTGARRFGSPNVPITKISYDDKSKDLTLYYNNDAVIKYLEVNSNVISDLNDLVAENVSGDKIIGFLYTALTKPRTKEGSKKVGGYVYRIDKYYSVIIKDGKSNKVQASNEDYTKEAEQVLYNYVNKNR